MMSSTTTGLRVRLALSPPVKRTTTNRERCKAYRGAIAADPLRRNIHKEHEAQRSRDRRRTAGPEEVIRSRELSRLRNIEYRKRKRDAIDEVDGIAKRRITRSNDKATTDKRERNRLAQQKRRRNMSAQKRRRENEKKREMRRKRKEANYTQLQCVNGGTSDEANTMTPSARRSAAYRFRKGVRPVNFVRALANAVRSTARSSPALQHLGVTYLSPKKKTNAHPEITELMEEMRRKRDRTTVAMKRTLATKIKAKYRSGRGCKAVKNVAALYQRKDTHDNIAAFFEEKSVHLPTKRTVSVKTQSQRKVLDMSMRNLHELYIKDRPDQQVSFSAFCKHRPRHVLSFTKTPLQQCMCECCINPMLKIKELHRMRAGSEVISSVDALVGRTVCDGVMPRMACLERSCADCGVSKYKEEIKSGLQTIETSIRWMRWEKKGEAGKQRVTLVEKRDTVGAMIEELCLELEPLAMHVFVHQWQTKQYRELHSDIPQGWAITTMDFAENYLCVQQDQPQSAYFGYTQVTLHPTVSCYSCPQCRVKVTHNVVYLSDILTHDPHFVEHATRDVQRRIEQRMRQITRHVIFSDGCASQYKSKLPFHYLANHAARPFQMERCYFGARHGKNPCDALGGIVKQVASHAVAARQIIIQSAADLFAFCEMRLQQPSATDPSQDACVHTRREFALVASDDVSAVTISSSLRTVPGTRAMHSIKPDGKGIAARNLACFCAGCRAGDRERCVNRDHVSEWRPHIIRRMQPGRNGHSQPATDVNRDTGPSHSATDVNRDTGPSHPATDVNRDTGPSHPATDVNRNTRPSHPAADVNRDTGPSHPAADVNRDTGPSHPAAQSVAVGTFVSVDLPVGKKTRRFMAEVLMVDDQKVALKYMRQLDCNLYAWPEEDDISTESIEIVAQIVGHPVPVLNGQRLAFKF